MLNEREALNIIKLRLSNQRFQHSLAVAKIAREMAERNGVDEDKAYLTGLLHDYAKGISGQDLLKIAEENNLIKDQVDREVPDLLHAPVGAFLLARDLDLNDEEILRAVSYHTLGALDMTALDKIIYMADMIEPGRDFPGLERLRCLAVRSLDAGMLFGLESTIKYCIDSRRILHPRTIAVRNQYLRKLDGWEC